MCYRIKTTYSMFNSEKLLHSHKNVCHNNKDTSVGAHPMWLPPVSALPVCHVGCVVKLAPDAHATSWMASWHLQHPVWLSNPGDGIQRGEVTLSQLCRPRAAACSWLCLIDANCCPEVIIIIIIIISSLSYLVGVRQICIGKSSGLGVTYNLGYMYLFWFEQQPQDVFLCSWPSFVLWHD